MQRATPNILTIIITAASIVIAIIIVVFIIVIIIEVAAFLPGDPNVHLCSSAALRTTFGERASDSSREPFRAAPAKLVKKRTLLTC